MKELSIEEKAAAYDEALKVANKYKDTHIMFPSIKDEMFPELKESEDERIKNKLIKLVKISNKVGGFALHKWEADEMLAWLEKQNEQKSTYKIEPKFKVGDKIHCKFDDRTFVIKEVDLGKGVYLYTEKGCGNDIDYADEMFELVIDEWSEEDEQYVKDTLALLSFGCSIHKITQVQDWLKSLKGRYTWKPSEEQMDALDDVISSRDIKYDVLSELYKDLKKLREE